MPYGKTLASSNDRHNANMSPTQAPTVWLRCGGGEVIAVNSAFTAAMGISITGTGGGYSEIWDCLNIGGRITQDTVTPSVVRLGLPFSPVTQPINIKYDGTAEEMAVTIQQNLAQLYYNLNKVIFRETTRDTYLINYKLMRSWTDSGGAADGGMTYPIF